MKRLNNKHILLGITGSIAAYKAADLIRRCREAGAEVRVVMTDGAKAFVTPLTFQALSGFPVHESLLDKEAEAAMGHIELARWADVILISPASANSLASLAHGMADSLLNAVVLASEVPLAIAPAMNKHMWADDATQDNVRLLAQRGVLFIGPDSGDQACGDVGEGRMVDSETIISRLSELFSTGSLAGLTVLLTAGPTREAIDPVRFLSNFSSGKMAYAIAEAAAEAGASVILISGPVNLQTPDRVRRIDVESAAEMEVAVRDHISAAEIFIAAAAVADYRPVTIHSDKIKKDNERLTIELEKNADILSMVKADYPSTFCLGFAAETKDLEKYARSKLNKKNIDLIAANLVGAAAKNTMGTFNSEMNELFIYWKDGELKLELASKTKIARQLIAITAQRYSLFDANTPTENNIISIKGN